MSNKIKNILDERYDQYGSFEINANIAQNLKGIASIGTSLKAMEPYQKEAIEMILNKVSRIVCGDSDYLDSWMDIIGYASLVVEVIERKGAKDVNK